MAPVSSGEAYGTLKLSLKGEQIAKKQLFAASSVAQAGIFDRLWDHAVLFFKELLGLI